MSIYREVLKGFREKFVGVLKPLIKDNNGKLIFTVDVTPDESLWLLRDFTDYYSNLIYLDDCFMVDDKKYCILCKNINILDQKVEFELYYLLKEDITESAYIEEYDVVITYLIQPEFSLYKDKLEINLGVRDKSIAHMSSKVTALLKLMSSHWNYSRVGDKELDVIKNNIVNFYQEIFGKDLECTLY